MYYAVHVYVTFSTLRILDVVIGRNPILQSTTSNLSFSGMENRNHAVNNYVGIFLSGVICMFLYIPHNAGYCRYYKIHYPVTYYNYVICLAYLVQHLVQLSLQILTSIIFLGVHLIPNSARYYLIQYMQCMHALAFEFVSYLLICSDHILSNNNIRMFK